MGTLGRAIYTIGFWITETGQPIDRLGSLYLFNPRSPSNLWCFMFYLLNQRMKQNVNCICGLISFSDNVHKFSLVRVSIEGLNLIRKPNFH
ncbi:hypothetical protein CsatB_008752 [Cannabis sativa]